MKRKAFGIFCLILCLVVSVFSGCGKPEFEPEYIPEPEPEIESEPEPEPVLVPVLESYVLTVIGSNPETFTVGDNIEIDHCGRLVEITKRYESILWDYNPDGTVAGIYVTDDEGSMSFGEWTYENGLPVSYFSDPNDGWHYVDDSSYETTVDENGRVTELIKNTTFTDPEDGSKSSSSIRYVYSYDENGFVSSYDYYSDGKYDHTTYLTYDEYGNLTVFSSIGANDFGEYIRIEFTYKLVDESEVSIPELDPFTYYLSHEFLLGGIL